MKNLFHADAYQEIMQRLSSLTPLSQRKWGKMDIAQMLARAAQRLKCLSVKKGEPGHFWVVYWAG